MANDNWITPDWLFIWLNNEIQKRFNLRFDVDLAADSKNTKVDLYIDKTTNSLNVAWHKESTCGFCNPPYSKPNLPEFTQKAFQEGLLGYTSVLLVPFDITGWFREWVANKAEIWVPNERIPFIEPETGKPIGTPPKGSMLVLYGPRVQVGRWEVVHIPRWIPKELRTA